MDRETRPPSSSEQSRLSALRALNLLDTVPEEAFDRLTRLVARYLGAPVALLSLVDDKRQFFKSAIGLQEPWAARRETPLSHAFCRFVVESRAPLVVQNAPEHPGLQGHPGISELGIVAYAGVPLATRDGHVLGSLCAIDCVPHAWSPMDIDVLHDLAASVMAEVELRAEIVERQRTQALAANQQRVLERAALGHSLPDILGEVITLVEQSSPEHVALVVHGNRDPRRFHCVASPEIRDPLRIAFEDACLRERSAVARAIRSGGPVHVDAGTGTWDSSDALQTRCAEHGFRSCSVIPIAAGTQAAGALVLLGSGNSPTTTFDATAVDAGVSLIRLALERAATESDRRIKEERFRILVENVPAGFFMIGLPEWTVDYESPGVATIYGWDRDGGLHEPMGWLAQVHEEDQDRVAGMLRANLEHPLGIDYRIRRSDGEVRYVHDRTFFVRDATGAPAHLVRLVTDITERRNLETSLQQAQKMEVVGQLAGGLAHDFNNLLTAVLGNVELAKSDLPAGHPVNDSLDDAHEAATRAAALTRQLLMFSRKQPFALQRLDLNTVVRDATKLLRRALGERAVLDLALSDEAPIAMADAGQVEQVLMNLVVKARDAMPNGGIVTVESGIVDRAAIDGARHDVPPGRYALLSVRDTGIGMSAEVLSHVFEPFFTTKPLGRGTGLGLATVYGIARQLGGTVQVESTVGSGSVFTLLIPLVEGDDATVASAVAAPTIPRGTERVLLVEDEANVRTLVKRLLERRGYSVYEARHGVDARLVWQERSDDIDLVLTDLRMPEMGGVELIERLREDRPDIPVLFMSGYAGSDDGAAAELNRTETVVLKPFTEDSLLGAVRRKLDIQHCG